MLQLIDLAKENAALRSELARIRQESEELQRLLSGDEDAPSRTFRKTASSAPEDHAPGD
jgi:hypothetical protein